MHQAFYLKYRPSAFGSVYGQEHITSVLKYEVANGKTTHSYLFCGSRGTGKTTCARLLAKAVNCLAPIDGEPCGVCEACRSIDAGTATDVLELDAASNNSVENVRDIRDEIIYSPAALKYRVYIIDEVHMLSTAAFNALLKTLEEPPDNVIFILATTELQKIPATIMSRCQRFDFRRIGITEISDNLTRIAGLESIGLDHDAALLIARLAQGGMRDAISTLELCSGKGTRVTEELVRATAGIAGRGALETAVDAIARRDVEAIFACVASLYASSLDITVFWNELTTFYRDMLVIISTKNPRAYLELTDSEFETAAALAAKFSRESLSYQSMLADEALVRMSRANSSKRLIAELTLIRMSDPRLGGDISALGARVAALEEAAASKPAAQTKPVEPAISAAANNSSTASDVPEAGKAEPKTPIAASPAVDYNNTDIGNAVNAVDTADSEVYMSWPDAVNRFAAEDFGMTTGALRIAVAYRAGDRFIISADSDFNRQLIDKDDVKAKLARILSALESKAIPPSGITITTAPPDTAKHSGIDDLTL